MKQFLFAFSMVFLFAQVAFGADNKVSENTQTCIECHSAIHPGIVADWKQSRMAQVTPAEVLKKTALERRISVQKVPEGLSDVVVGCAECHTLSPETHEDTFEHEGTRVHIVVTPKDCSTCHLTEVEQYGKNLMSHAYGNLNKTPVYHDLVESINGVQDFQGITTNG